MNYVCMPERDQFRADLKNQIESLKVLISHTTARSGEDSDLQATGAYLFAALTTLDRHDSKDIDATGEGIISGTDCPALVTATLAAAGAIQEAIACADLLSLRAELVLSLSDFRELSDRLARVDTAFRIVAAHTVKKRVIAIAG